MNRLFKELKKKFVFAYTLILFTHPTLFLVFPTVLVLSGFFIATQIESSVANVYEEIHNSSNVQTKAKISAIEEMTYVNIGAMGNSMNVIGLKINYSFNYKGKYYSKKEMFKFGAINSGFQTQIKKMKVGDLCPVYFNSDTPEINTIYSE